MASRSPTHSTLPNNSRMPSCRFSCTARRSASSTTLFLVDSPLASMAFRMSRSSISTFVRIAWLLRPIATLHQFRMPLDQTALALGGLPLDLLKAKGFGYRLLVSFERHQPAQGLLNRCPLGGGPSSLHRLLHQLVVNLDIGPHRPSPPRCVRIARFMCMEVWPVNGLLQPRPQRNIFQEPGQ